MIPRDYQCDGQLNIWDYASSIEKRAKPYEYNFNRFIGQKVRVWIDDEVFIGKITEFDHYYTFVEVHGEELAFTNKEIAPVDDEELPSLAEVVDFLEYKFELKFESLQVDYLAPNSINDTVFRHQFYKGSVLEVSESLYLDNEHKRHIGISWDGKGQGTGCPCDTIEEVVQAVKKAIERSEEQKNVSKRSSRRTNRSETHGERK